MMPDWQTIRRCCNPSNGKEVNIGNVLDIINRRIEFLFDREHTIGHAFFTLTKNEDSIQLNRLANIFRNSIIPLTRVFLR